MLDLRYYNFLLYSFYFIYFILILYISNKHTCTEGYWGGGKPLTPHGKQNF